MHASVRTTLKKETIAESVPSHVATLLRNLLSRGILDEHCGGGPKEGVCSPVEREETYTHICIYDKEGHG